MQIRARPSQIEDLGVWARGVVPGQCSQKRTLLVQHGAARSGVRGEAEESLALRLGRLAHDLAAMLLQPALQRAPQGLLMPPSKSQPTHDAFSEQFAKHAHANVNVPWYVCMQMCMSCAVRR